MSSIIGYKIAKNDNNRVIITMEILGENNMNRIDIFDIKYAKHRTNKVKVLQIEDDLGKLYDHAFSCCYKKSLLYKVGEILSIDDYDNNIDKVSTSGIHYFLEKSVAYFYNLNYLENGLFQQWYENGSKHIECTFVIGKKNGLFKKWYDNGKIYEEYILKDNLLNGYFAF